MNNQQPRLPETGFLRLREVLKLIPISKTTFWEYVNKGIYPRPIKLGTRASAWRVEDIKDLIEALSKTNKMKNIECDKWEGNK